MAFHRSVNKEPYTYHWLKEQPIDVLNAMFRILKQDGRGRPFTLHSKVAWELTGTHPEWKDRLPAVYQEALATLDTFKAENLVDDGNAPKLTVDSIKDTSQEATGESQLSAIAESVLADLKARLGSLEARDTITRLEARHIVIKAVEAEARAIIAEAIKTVQLPREVHIVKLDGTKLNAGIQHFRFPDLLRKLSAHLNVWLVGPAGTGKTTAAEKAAAALGVPFYVTGQSDVKYDLSGFIDAQGRIVNTEFRRAWETGGVWLADEIDGWDANACLALNGGLSSDWVSFPDGKVKRHPDFYCIAAANTWGQGADFDYVGRTKQDAAFLDRFVTLTWPIDEAIEDIAAGDPEWVANVRKYRAQASAKGIKVIISPRASIYGARCLAAGDTWEQAEESCIRKSMKPDQWAAIGGK